MFNKLMARPTTVRRTGLELKLWIGRAALVVAGLFIGLLFLEMAASWWRFAKHGRVGRDVLLERRMSNLRPERNMVKMVKEHRLFESMIVPHPLFGYTLNPKLSGINNFGFDSEYDFSLADNRYSIKDQDNRDLLVVGIFGGSFAQQTGQLGEVLEQELVEYFPEKIPVVVNMALGGHALPQSAFIYLYFRELFDIVVFIDGLNEVWNYTENNRVGLPPEYAKAAQYQYKLSRQELTPKTFELTSSLVALERGYRNITALSLRPMIRNSIVVHYLWNVRARFLSRRIAETSLAIESDYKSTHRFFEYPDDDILGFAARQWRDYHYLIHHVAIKQGALSIHLLQPNPFVPQSKQMTIEETELITKTVTTQPVDVYVIKGYPKLRSEIPALQAQGIIVDDLTNIYKDVSESVWVDFCHANDYGYRFIIDEIIHNIQNASATNWP